jgi:hypothetical protein
MARFTKSIALAQKLIKKNGRNVTITFPSTTLADPAKPWEGVTTSSNTKVVKGVFTNYARTDQRNVNDGVPTNVQVGDQKLLVAAGDITPDDIKTATTVDDRSTTWKVINVEVVDPGDDPILYKLQLRA